jgi:hypothetical protein
VLSFLTTPGSPCTQLTVEEAAKVEFLGLLVDGVMTGVFRVVITSGGGIRAITMLMEFLGL